MNKYKIYPLLIHVTEKEQTVHANNVVDLIMHNAPLILNGIPFLVADNFFFGGGNQIETRQENVIF